MIKVIILCGGRGHRLKPLTARMPKPMVSLNGKPVVQRNIEFYMRHGFRDFVLCVGYRADVIKGFVNDRRFGASIALSNAGVDAGILKRIYEARHLIDERAIVTYGDTFIDIDPKRIIAAHRKNRCPVTITIADFRSPFGLVGTDRAMHVTSFEEKPLFQYYIGHMIVDRAALDALDPSLLRLPDGEGLVEFFKRLARRRRLGACKHDGLQITFNTPQEHKKAEEDFVKFFTEQEG